MRRSSAIAIALRALLCLALILPGAGALHATSATADEGWLVICGADGPYRVPAPGGQTETPAPASTHTDCAVCVTGCGNGCGPDCGANPADYGFQSDDGALASLRNEGVDAHAKHIGFTHRPRGPPEALPT